MRFVKQTPITAISRHVGDFEQLGYDTMVATRDREATERICGLHLHAFSDDLQPTIQDLEGAIAQQHAQAEALQCDLYERDEPVRDVRMLAHRIAVSILGVLTVAAILASIASQVASFFLTGEYLVGLFMGPGLTALSIVVGYLVFETLLRHKLLFSLAVAIAGALFFWGLIEWSEARALTAAQAETATSVTTPSSYVDGAAEPAAEQPPASSDEAAVKKLRKQAWIKFLLSADLLVGIFLGLFKKMRTDEDYTAWLKLKDHFQEISRMQLERAYLLTRIEIAKKQCMAGILRAQHQPRKKHRPYFRTLVPALVVVALLRLPVEAQTITRQEVILIDVSGSIGSGGSNNELFREYLQAVKKHLEALPPGSRVVVSVITTDSFGSVQELMKGWTPEAHGVFTTELARARRQLAASFEAKSSAIKPISAGTDIFGALWRVKAVMEAATKDDDHVTREIWIWSDMMNEAPTFDMPALLALGPDKMVQHARTNGLLVPLKGYTVHIRGASTRGLSPQAWNTLKSFWSEYFHEAGAELTGYSSESSND